MSSQVIVNEITKDDITIEGIDNSNMIGIHTYSCTNDYEVIDVRHIEFSPFCQWRKVLRR